MPRVRAIASVGALAFAIGCLAACTSGHGAARAGKTPAAGTPTVTPTPVFTSDAEALAAATEVYKKFEAAVDAIGRDGGENPERVKPYVTDKGYRFELAEAAKYKAEHSHGTGRTVLNNAVLQSHEEKDGVATVTMYVCEDVSDVDRVGPDGKSLVSPERDDYIDYLVVLRGEKADQLVIQSDKYWTGGEICKF